MTIEVLSQDDDGQEVMTALNEEMQVISDLTEEAYSLSPQDFAAKKVVERDLVLFLLLRDMAGEMRALKFKVEEYEQKAKELGTPEGIQALTDKFLGGSGFGGMLGMFK